MQFSLDILATDFVPDKMTTSFLCATIMQQEEEMKRIDETIHDLECRIQELRAQKVSIQRSRDVNRALVASERRLPPEMLGEVFGHYLTRSFSHHRAQLLLMQVCRRWRRIAAATPSLWTNLALQSKSERLNLCPIIRMVVANSGALPMTANVRTRNWSNQWNKQEAIRLLAENFHRFRHFVGDESEELYRGIFGHETLIHAPLLEYFVIHRWLSESTLASGLPPSAGECIRAPRLKAISLPRISLMDHISFDPMSLCELTFDVGGTQDILSSLHILASCPNICVLKFRLTLYTVETPDIEGRPRSLLPCLNELSVEFDVWNFSYAFLRTIEAPELKKLSIRPEYLDRTLELSPLLAALDSLCGHNPPLQDLHLFSVPLEDGPPLTSILGRLENIRYLTLSKCTIGDYILEFLTPDNGQSVSEWKCPLLSVLDVSDSWYSLDLFLRLVRSRVPMGRGGADGGRYLEQVVVSASNPSRTNTERRRAFIAALEDIQESCGRGRRIIIFK